MKTKLQALGSRRSAGAVAAVLVLHLLLSLLTGAAAAATPLITTAASDSNAAAAGPGPPSSLQLQEQSWRPTARRLLLVRPGAAMATGRTNEFHVVEGADHPATTTTAAAPAKNGGHKEVEFDASMRPLPHTRANPNHN